MTARRKRGPISDSPTGAPQSVSGQKPPGQTANAMASKRWTRNSRALKQLLRRRVQARCRAGTGGISETAAAQQSVLIAAEPEAESPWAAG